jgi:putative transcriptional regulator
MRARRWVRGARRWLGAVLAAGWAVCLAEPPNAVLLVAKPGLVDPNFSRTVVLVTQAEDASTVGVILNRPTTVRHERTGEPIHSGGPVMPRTMVALFRSESAPPAPSFHVLQGVYLSMHPAIVERLQPPYRIYAGFAGWTPGQLESEIARDGWYLLPASEELLFRRDSTGMWEELLDRASAHRTRGAGKAEPAFHR